MNSQKTSLRLRGVYEVASIIEKCVQENYGFIEIDWTDREVCEGLARFDRVSILHCYLYGVLAAVRRSNYHDDSENLDSKSIARIEGTFRAYCVPYLDFETFRKDEIERGSFVHDDYCFYDWFQALDTHFQDLWEHQTREALHLLFGNRRFLLQFNVSLSEYLADEPDVIPAEYRKKDGTIKRCQIPVWVKKAVYFRDQGRCTLCQVDLSGLLSTDRRVEYDHIVPLARFGVNDPCNIQLLCASCNSKKSAGKSITGDLYAAWWDYE